MTILAQHWLDAHEATPFDKEFEAVLALPEGPEGLKSFASRIVYDEPLDEIVCDLGPDGLDWEMVARTTKLPNRFTWVETKLRNLEKNGSVRYGVLFTRSDDPAKFADFLYLLDKITFPSILAKGFIPTHSNGKDWWRTVFTSFADDRAELFLRTQQHPGTSITHLLCGLFFLQHPKTIHIEHSLPVAPKLQKAREKRGKPPLITYRRIHLLVGKRTVAHYPNCQNGFGHEHYGKVRYHRVEGHWRRLHWDDPARATVVFVQEHYRGDPTIGVSLTERHVHGAAA